MLRLSDSHTASNPDGYGAPGLLAYSPIWGEALQNNTVQHPTSAYDRINEWVCLDPDLLPFRA